MPLIWRTAQVVGSITSETNMFPGAISGSGVLAGPPVFPATLLRAVGTLHAQYFAGQLAQVIGGPSPYMAEVNATLGISGALQPGATSHLWLGTVPMQFQFFPRIHTFESAQVNIYGSGSVTFNVEGRRVLNDGPRSILVTTFFERGLVNDTDVAIHSQVSHRWRVQLLLDEP